jgi:hypothetical protein
MTEVEKPNTTFLHANIFTKSRFTRSADCINRLRSHFNIHTFMLRTVLGNMTDLCLRLIKQYFLKIMWE